MAYVSSSPILSDRSRFKSFWRTYPSDTSASHAVLALVLQYEWNKLKILTQQENIFIEVCLFIFCCCSFARNLLYPNYTKCGLFYTVHEQ